MRKNLLTMMPSLSFLFFGMFVTNAEASTDNVPNSVKINRIEFNKKIVKLKLLCKNKVGSQCDIAIAQADLGAAIAWYICNVNINACQEAQDIAINQLNNAMEICSLESQIQYNQSSIEKRKTPIRTILADTQENA